MTVDLKKQCASKIKDAIVPNITGVDKVEACKYLSISRVTLDRYLSGDIPNIETAINIIEFFHNKIAVRLQRLSAA